MPNPKLDIHSLLHKKSISKPSSPLIIALLVYTQLKGTPTAKHLGPMVFTLVLFILDRRIVSRPPIARVISLKLQPHLFSPMFHLPVEYFLSVLIPFRTPVWNRRLTIEKDS